MERQISYILTDINRMVEIAKMLPPRKLYTQEKLKKLAKEYSKK